MPAPWTVPLLWPGETAIIVAGGPSLTQTQVDACRGRARLIVINDGYRQAPWADLLYFCDTRWWEWHREKPEFRAFAGLRVTLSEDVSARDPAIHWLRNSGVAGFDDRRDSLRNGANSGYQALHLAVHLGARRILLLGYDMRLGEGGREHWFGSHPGAHPLKAAHFELFRRNFETLVEPLRARGVEVVNATPGSALTCFPARRLEDCLLDPA